MALFPICYGNRPQTSCRTSASPSLRPDSAQNGRSYFGASRGPVKPNMIGLRSSSAATPSARKEPLRPEHRFAEQTAIDCKGGRCLVPYSLRESGPSTSDGTDGSPWQERCLLLREINAAAPAMSSTDRAAVRIPVGIWLHALLSNWYLLSFCLQAVRGRPDRRKRWIIRYIGII
jgi:hypothetical protein